MKTTKQKVFEFIYAYINNKQHSPSTREIAKAVNVSQPMIVYYLDKLQTEKKIKYTAKMARSIVLLD